MGKTIAITILGKYLCGNYSVGALLLAGLFANALTLTVKIPIQNFFNRIDQID